MSSFREVQLAQVGRSWQLQLMHALQRVRQEVGLHVMMRFCCLWVFGKQKRTMLTLNFFTACASKM